LIISSCYGEWRVNVDLNSGEFDCF